MNTKNAMNVKNAAEVVKALKEQMQKLKEELKHVKTNAYVSHQHIQLLKAVATSSRPIPSSRFRLLAKQAGYPKGLGASACFRGRAPSLTHKIDKFVVLTKRGQRLLLDNEKKNIDIKKANVVQPALAAQ